MGRKKAKGFVGSGGLEYLDRNNDLLALGYETYQEYLDSEAWASIRSHVLEAEPGCYGCGKKATQVHHGSYLAVVLTGQVLKSDWREVLFSVCRKCHKHIEYSGAGRKHGPRTATRKLRNLRAMKYVKRRKGQNILSKAQKLQLKRMKKGFCPECGVNRLYRGGPCPPCLKGAMWPA